ncbi:hypothetical protein OG592_41660 (plasmid) [Streptomyces avidinii]|uniref:hypothetical protein n=1 Tax=Streptomyces avidinii TaxID=1895 RepID=UPI003865A307|nr:hypothetical protein OG592_41660 [Streptomyces avidinii]
MDMGDGTRHVMFVDVFPPKWGDPIHPLRKAHANAYAGTVFYRYPGRTQPAGPGEIDALTERARRAAQRIDVAVEMHDGALALVPFNQDTIEQSLSEYRDKLLEQLSAPSEDETPLTTRWAIRSLATTDHRTQDEFREEVEEYLRERAAATEEFLLRATGTAGTPLRVKLSNPGETFFAKVEVVLTLSAPVRAYAWDEDDEIYWPQKPAAYGTRSFPPSWIGASRTPVFSGQDPLPQIEQEEDRLVVRYRPVDLRPHDSLQLPPVLFYSYSEAADAVVQWTATATNVSGHKRDRFVLPAERVPGPSIEEAASLLQD